MSLWLPGFWQKVKSLFWGYSQPKGGLWSFRDHLFFFFWPRCAAYGILVPRPGIEPRPSAVRARSPNHWTAREFPRPSLLSSSHLLPQQSQHWGPQFLPWHIPLLPRPVLSQQDSSWTIVFKLFSSHISYSNFESWSTLMFKLLQRL